MPDGYRLPDAGGVTEEDSLAQNVQRVPLHPLDLFRAFGTLRVIGLGDDEIAARFFVSTAIVERGARYGAMRGALAWRPQKTRDFGLARPIK